MSRVKEIEVKMISAYDANGFVRKYHYSGKVVNNSKLHFGAFLDGRLHGVLSFGSPLDKRKVLHLVKGTLWHEMIELNRMAFDEALPKNSESRCIAIAMRMIRKNAPHVKWVISFADGMQCGDGTIYRASGFVLTGFSEASMYELPEDLAKINGGPVAHRMSLQCKSSTLSKEVMRRTNGKNLTNSEYCRQLGMKVVPGFMLRYIYFLRHEERANLTVPVLPFSEIEKRGAGMYRGNKRVASIDDDAAAFQAEKGGSIPTATLQRSVIGKLPRRHRSEEDECPYMPTLTPETSSIGLLGQRYRNNDTGIPGSENRP